MNLFNCSVYLNLFKCKAKICGSFFTLILKHEIQYIMYDCLECIAWKPACGDRNGFTRKIFRSVLKNRQLWLTVCFPVPQALLKKVVYLKTWFKLMSFLAYLGHIRRKKTVWPKKAQISQHKPYGRIGTLAVFIKLQWTLDFYKTKRLLPYWKVSWADL